MRSIPMAVRSVLLSATVAACPSFAAEPPGSQPQDVIVVTGQRPNEATQAAKDDVPLLENPQAISVVSAELIEAQGYTDLIDALRNVAGVSRSSTYGFFDAYTIRGYDAAYGSVYLDGVVSEAGVGTNYETAGLEQVEVLKGPASTLFGSAPLGGIVNMVSKRPLEEAFAHLRLATGTYDRIEGTFDANAPLTASGSLLGRTVVHYVDADSFVDFAAEQRLFVAPSLTWNIGDRTRVTFLGSWQRDRDNPFSPVHAWGTILPHASGEVPIDYAVNNSGAQNAFIDQERRSLGYTFEHGFSDSIELQQTLRATRRDMKWDRWMFVAGILDSDVIEGVQHGRTLGRYYYGPYDESTDDLAVDTRIRFDFATGTVHHSVLTGIDHRRTDSAYTGDGDFDPANNPLDLFGPDHAAPLTLVSAPYEDGSETRQTGFYVQDHLSFGDRFTFTVGGRWDETEADGQKDSAFSPRAGATWALTPQTSLYGSWSRSFTPNPSWYTAADGSYLPPERGANIEVGLKTISTDRTLSAMVSVFNLTRSDVATEDPFNPFFYIVTGEQRSRGIEIEGGWAPTSAWQFTGAYAYIDGEITEDNTFPAGTPLQNAPGHNLNLWGKYTFQQGPLANLGLSLGFLYNSERHFFEYGDRLYTLPSYTVTDVGVSYRLGDWGVQLNVNNVFDKRYFPDACCVDRVTPGEPRDWRLSLSRSFGN